jgi:hypothetical protein
MLCQAYGNYAVSTRSRCRLIGSVGASTSTVPPEGDAQLIKVLATYIHIKYFELDFLPT